LRASSDQTILSAMMPMMVTAVMMPMAVVVPRSAHIGRPQIDIDDAGDGAQAGLALQAQRLQRNRIVRSANQQVGAEADADRGIGANTAEVTGERAAAEPVAWRVDRPRKAGLRRHAEIETETLDARNVGLSRRAGIAAENALQFRRRADNIADVLAALAFEDAGLNLLLLGMRACKGRNERHCGHGEKSWEVHEFNLRLGN